MRGSSKTTEDIGHHANLQNLLGRRQGDQKP